MKLADVLHELHVRLKKHHTIEKDGIGVFSVCESRLPWGKRYVSFRPDFYAARWWPVPVAENAEGVTLFRRMLKAENAWHAMSMLRAQYTEDSSDVA